MYTFLKRIINLFLKERQFVNGSLSFKKKNVYSECLRMRNMFHTFPFVTPLLPSLSAYMSNASEDVQFLVAGTVRNDLSTPLGRLGKHVTRKTEKCINVKLPGMCGTWNTT